MSYNIENNYMLGEDLVRYISQNNCKKLREKLKSFDANNLVRKATYKLPFNIGHIPSENLTLLHIAAYYDSMECFLYLVDVIKARSRNEEEAYSVLSAKGYYPLHYALFNTSTEVSLYILNKAKKQASENHEGADFFPLALAVIGGMPQIVDELLDIGKDNITQKQISQAFEMALNTRNYPCLKSLILKRTADRPNKNIQETIPMKAAYTLSQDAVSLVLEHEEDSLDKIYYNPINTKYESDCLLCRLCRSKPPLFKKQIIELLNLLNGKEIEPIKEYKVKGPCHWMCYFGDVEIAEKICSEFIININRLDGENQPGAFELLREGLEEEDIIKMLDFLIKHDYNINNFQLDTMGKLVQKTLLEKFVSHPKINLKVIRYLLSQNANPDAQSFIQQGKYGTIRGYVKIRRAKDTELNALFDEFPPKNQDV